MIKRDLVTKNYQKIYGSMPDFCASSPGRIEFIGNHTDYNGGLVLGASLNLGISVAIGRRSDRKIYFTTDAHPNASVELELSDIKPLVGEESWINYPLGVFNVLLERGLDLGFGFNFYVISDLPTGAGLSSSAALELASLKVFCELYAVSLTEKEMILICQKAENEFVGVPCGILDQAVSRLGQTDHLVKIDCDKITFDVVPMPSGLSFLIFNTNIKHRLLDSMYSKRHLECRSALKTIRETQPTMDHLCHASLDDLNLIDDPIVLRRARHIVTENNRVKSTIEDLRLGKIDQIGTALFASHESSRIDFENSIPEIDYFVELLKETKGVIGARLTGGGFGGAVMALVDAKFTDEASKEILKKYKEKFKEAPQASVIEVVTGNGTQLI